MPNIEGDQLLLEIERVNNYKWIQKAKLEMGFLFNHRKVKLCLMIIS